MKRTMKRFAWLFAAMLVLVPGSCNELDPEGGNNPYTSISLTTKQTGYVQAGTAFAWKFIDQVDEHARKEKEKEWFVSPLSLQIALGMLLNGAQNETAAEICRTLGYNEGETAEINAWCKLMLEQLPKVDKKTDLALADAIFYNKKLTLKGPFRNDVTSWYDAQLEALDFSKTKASADVINKWCDKQTKGMIPHVLDEVSPTALAYLVNALYFKSEWAEKFPKGNTQNETFTDEAGQKSQVKMMKLAGKEFNYGETDLCQIVNLPYGNGNFDIADTKGGSPTLTVYRCKYFDNANFDEETINVLKEGDEVVIEGLLQKYKDKEGNITPEIAQYGIIISINGQESAGLNQISADTDVNAPAYNVAGQRVNSSYKGVVVKNGKKFIK